MRKRDADRFRSQLEEQLAALVGQGERAVQEMVGWRRREVPIRTIARRSRRAELGAWLRDRDRKLISKIQEAPRASTRAPSAAVPRAGGLSGPRGSAHVR